MAQKQGTALLGQKQVGNIQAVAQVQKSNAATLQQGSGERVRE